MDFAPVLDVHTNRRIRDRQPRVRYHTEAVTLHALAFLARAHPAGVVGAGKPLPGTRYAADSHLDVAGGAHTSSACDAVEQLAPFRRRRARGIDSIMTAHVIYRRSIATGRRPGRRGS